MGFRPFFLLAGLFAVVGISTWLHALATGLNPAGDYLPLTLWHAHEMVFGFTLAVVAGFLLTAARNWTGQDTLHGWPLLGLATLWSVGRIAMGTASMLPPAVVAAVGVAFPAALTVIVGSVIVRSNSRRNFGIVAILGALTTASLAVHLDGLKVVDDWARPALYGALHLIVTLIVVIGGRIIPLFTRNKTGASTRSIVAIDRAAIGSAALVGLLAVAALGQPQARPLLAIAGVVSGLLQLVRMRTWGVGPGLRVPMLAVLHTGYAWIAAGHLLLAASVVSDQVSGTVAIHALTIGAIGTMTLGMMARVSQGHTGREVRAGWPMVLAFLGMNLAAVVRLAGALVPADSLALTWTASGLLFAGAFVAFLVVSARWLLTPRPDGRPG